MLGQRLWENLKKKLNFKELLNLDFRDLKNLRLKVERH